MQGGGAKEEFEKFVQNLVRPRPERAPVVAAPANITVTVNAPHSCRIYIGTDGSVKTDPQGEPLVPPRGA